MKWLFYLSMLYLQFVQMQSQVFPERYQFQNCDVMTANGSSVTGHCGFVISLGGIVTCRSSASSVLFDGIPILTGLDGDMWASQLLTLQPVAGMTEITFDFSNDTNFRMERVEVVMFNCPQWNIAVQAIRLLVSTSVTGNRALITTINSTTTSCNSLVRVCIPVTSTLPIITLLLLTSSPDWVHLAEVTFFSSGSTCPSETIITSTSLSPPAITTKTDPIILQTATVTDTTTTLNPLCPIISFSLTTILACAITAIVTALLATIIFVLVQIAVCKCRPKKSTLEGAETSTSVGEEYEQVDGSEGGVAVSDYTYLEVEVGNALELQRNEAYNSSSVMYQAY